MKTYAAWVMALGSVILLTGCGPKYPIVTGMPEGCPHDWQSVVVIHGEGDTARVGVALNSVYQALGRVTKSGESPVDVPEYHDCQRFLIRDARAGAQFDSLFAVFGVALDDLEERIDDDSPYAAIAAQIWTLGGRYDPLRIEPGISCLFMWGESATWQAGLIPVDENAGCPTQYPIGEISPGKQLEVIETRLDRGTQIPPVARWETNKAGDETRIGLRCGSSWCEFVRTIGPNTTAIASLATVTTSPIGSAAAPFSGSQLLRTEIKGYYDQQILDVREGDRLVSSGIQGWAVPDTQIGHVQKAEYVDEWIRSGYVYLTDLPPGYDKKLNLAAIPNWQTPNVVEFCMRGPDDCGLNEQQIEELDCAPSVDSHGEDWVSRITNAATEAKEPFCVDRHEHVGIHVPNTIRWRLDKRDAKLWARCDQGCCTIE